MSYTIVDVDRVIGEPTDLDEDGWLHWKYAWGDAKRRRTELGLIEYVDAYGGEGQGDDYWVVVKITDGIGDVRYFKRLGYYASYVGGELDGPTLEVKPVERTVTFYE